MLFCFVVSRTIVLFDVFVLCELFMLQSVLFVFV